MNKLRSRKGQGMIEYLMIAAFVVAIAIYLYTHVRPAAQTGIDNIATHVGNPGG